MFKITKQNFWKYLIGLCLIMLFIIESIQFGVLVGIIITIMLIAIAIVMSYLLPWIESQLPNVPKKKDD